LPAPLFFERVVVGDRIAPRVVRVIFGDRTVPFDLRRVDALDVDVDEHGREVDILARLADALAIDCHDVGIVRLRKCWSRKADQQQAAKMSSHDLHQCISWAARPTRILFRMSDPIAVFTERVAALRGGKPDPKLAWAIAHCAQSVECSMTAYPALRSRLFRATVGPLVKRKLLRAHAMSHDVTAPIPGAPEIASSTALDDACERAAAALRAFAAWGGELAPHLAYGRCTKAEYAELHLLHFEDHARALGA
jgi:hypothetical protein